MSKKYVIVASAFDRSGRLICSATNSYKDSGWLQRMYAIKVGRPACVYRHAEIGCLQKAISLKKKVDKLVIVRHDSEGQLKNAKPCSICSSAIKDFKIRKVIYSNSEGKMEEL